MAYEVMYPNPWGFGSAVNTGGITGSRSLIPYRHAGQGTMVGSGGTGLGIRGALRTMFGPTIGSLYGIGEMGAAQKDEMDQASDFATRRGLNLEDYITREGTRTAIDPSLWANPDITMPEGVAPFPGETIQETVNDDIHLDVGTGPGITPNVPRPGIIDYFKQRAMGGPYFSQPFGSQDVTIGDETFRQQSLGGKYHPDEVYNMREFGEIGEGTDPRKDQWGKNIVSFADDWEEGVEDWVGKYGDMKYKTDRMRRKQADKIAMLEQIQNRRAAIEAANRQASAQHLASQGIQVGGGGAWEDPGGRDRGGQGAFRENVQSMRSAGRSYKDAQGNVGYSRGRAAGGIIGAF